MSKVYIHFKDKDRHFGTSYVTVSRVKKLSDLMIDPFEPDRFELSDKVQITMNMVHAETKRLLALEQKKLQKFGLNFP